MHVLMFMNDRYNNTRNYKYRLVLNVHSRSLNEHADEAINYSMFHSKIAFEYPVHL